MKLYVILNDKRDCRHFDENSAEEAISRICYTDKDGKERHGARWSLEDILTATGHMPFGDGVTQWDKYVAFNSMYADLCKVLSPEDILKAAHAFYFGDEDTPEGKVWRYMDAMK